MTLIKYTATIRNNGPNNDFNVVVSFTPPTGATVQSIQPFGGVGVVVGNDWTLAEFKVGFVYKADVVLNVPDPSLLAGNLTISINGTLVEVVPANNIATGQLPTTMNCPGGQTVVVQTGPCPPPTATPVSDTAPLFNGYVGGNDTKCNAGVTEFRVLTGSEVNATIVKFDKTTGYYEVNPVDVTLPWSFQYNIYCIDACSACPTGNEWGPFGPATVSGNPVTGLNSCTVGMNGTGRTITDASTAGEKTLVITDSVVLVDNSSSAVAMTINPANVNLAGCGRFIHVVVIGDHPSVNAVSITASSGKIVDGTTVAAATNTFNFPNFGSIKLWSDGTNIYVL